MMLFLSRITKFKVEILLALPVLAFFISILVRLLINRDIYVNLDVSEGLYAAQMMSQGHSLYADWMLTNPPSIYMLYLAGEYLSQYTFLPALFIFYAFFGLFAVLGCVFILQLPEKFSAQMFALSYSAFIISVSSVGYTEFGEREYIFMIAILPYAFLRLGKFDFQGIRAVFLMFVGFSSLFKPQFVLFLVLLEAYLYKNNNAISRKKLFWIFAGAVLPYIALAIYDQNSFYAFLKNYPSLLLYYDVGASPRDLDRLVISDHYYIVIVLLGLLVLKVKKAPFFFEDTRHVFIIFVICSLISLIIQNKYWSYHWIPLFATISVFTYYALLKALKIPHWGKIFGVTSVLLAVIFYQHLYFISAKPNYYDYSLRFRPLLEDGDVVLPVSYSCKLLSSHYYSQVRFSGSWPHNFTLGALYQERSTNAHAEMELMRIRDQMRLELDAGKPKLVLVDVVPRVYVSDLKSIVYEYMRLLPHEKYRKLSNEEIMKCCHGSGYFDVWIRR